MNENKFTPRAEEALRLSQEAAGDLGHGYVCLLYTSDAADEL